MLFVRTLARALADVDFDRASVRVVADVFEFYLANAAVVGRCLLGVVSVVMASVTVVNDGSVGKEIFSRRSPALVLSVYLVLPRVGVKWMSRGVIVGGFCPRIWVRKRQGGGVRTAMFSRRRLTLVIDGSFVVVVFGQSIKCFVVSVTLSLMTSRVHFPFFSTRKGTSVLQLLVLSLLLLLMLLVEPPQLLDCTGRGR